MSFSESVFLFLMSAALNAGVVWGVVRTQLQWLRSDIARTQRDTRDAMRRAEHAHDRLNMIHDRRAHG